MEYGPPRSYVPSGRGCGGGQPVRRGPQTRRAAADGQPQDLGARSASQDAAPDPFDPQARAHRIGRGLCRRSQAHPRRGERGRARGSGEHAAPEAISSSLRRSFLAGFMFFRSSRSFSSDGPRSMSGLSSPTAICTSSTITSTSRSHRRARRQRLVSTRVGSVRRVVCGSPAYFAAHGVPKRPEDLSALPR